MRFFRVLLRLAGAGRVKYPFFILFLIVPLFSGPACLNHSDGFGGQGLFFWSPTHMLTLVGQIYSEQSENPTYSFARHAGTTGYLSGIIDTTRSYQYPVDRVAEEDFVVGGGSPLGDKQFQISNPGPEGWAVVASGPVTSLQGSLTDLAKPCENLYILARENANLIKTSLYADYVVSPVDYDICLEFTDTEPTICSGRTYHMADLLFSQTSPFDQTGRNGKFTPKVEEDFNTDFGAPDEVAPGLCGRGR